jgi:exosome complex component CSL4
MVTTHRRDELYCEVCDRKERRKISINYDSRNNLKEVQRT